MSWWSVGVQEPSLPFIINTPLTKGDSPGVTEVCCQAACRIAMRQTSQRFLTMSALQILLLQSEGFKIKVAQEQLWSKLKNVDNYVCSVYSCITPLAYAHKKGVLCYRIHMSPVGYSSKLQEYRKLLRVNKLFCCIDLLIDYFLHYTVVAWHCAIYIFLHLFFNLWIYFITGQ